MSSIERERVGPLPVWGWGLACGVLVWCIYALTLAPTTGFWDTSEYVATAQILGLPHPPGNPLFVVIGRVWITLLGWTGLSVPARINLLSATLSAAAAVFWFLSIARIVAHFWESRRDIVVGASVATLVSATAFTVWTQSNLNEKVYTVSLFVVALITYLALVWEDEAETPRGDRLLLLIALILGLGAANHTMSVLPIPALLLFVLWHRWRTILRWRLVLGSGLLLAVGFSVQLLFVPIRSAQNPIIDEADPECASLVEALIPKMYEDRYGDKKLGVVCEDLALSLMRDQYAKPPLAERQAPLSAQYANYWQYFDWQWARTLGRGPRSAVTVVFLFLALLGLWQHWKGDRDSFLFLGTLLFTMSLLLVYYLNFKYGYSLYADTVPALADHEVRERDYFYVVGFSVWGLYVGLGIVALWGQLAAHFDTRLEGREGSASSGYKRASPILALAFIPLVFNFGLANRAGDFAARDWAYNILQSVEPYGVLFTNGDNDTFPLWYLQEVEGIRRDVTVIVHSYLGTQWYPKQLSQLTTPCEPGVDPGDTPTVIVCQRPFDREAAVGPYRDHAATAPTRSIIAYTEEEIDTLPTLVPIQQDTTLRVTDWVYAYLRSGDYITYPDILVYHIVQNSLGDRPVYFAVTAPPVYGVWGFQPHMLRQGLAFKLIDGPLEETVDTVNIGEQIPGSPPWIDRPRSRELLWDVFQLDYLLDWDIWPEPSTRASIPAQYYLAYITLGLAEELVDNREEADRSLLRADRLFQLSNPGAP
jgi:hypothetical protein